MTRGPIYVQIKNEPEVLDLIDTLKQELLDAKQLLHDLYDVRAQENKEIHEAKQRLKQMQERITVIDEEVFS